MTQILNTGIEPPQVRAAPCEACQRLIAEEGISKQNLGEELRERCAEQLRQAQKMEAVGRLAGGVAHDLNNLLCIILGYSEAVLSDLYPNHPYYPAIQAIQEAGNRAAALTKQLQLFSRKRPAVATTVDLNVIVMQLDSIIRRQLGDAIEPLLLPASRPARVRADIAQVEQVIVNLATNAREAMPNGGRLLIQISHICNNGQDILPDQPPGNYVRLSITDEGCGMDHYVRERIFEPFFTTKTAGKGTGLGLSTVFGIVQQWSGCIHVQSEVDHGTTFDIFLPSAEDRTAGAPQLRSGGSGLDAKRETILLADDEPAVRELIGGVLSRNGYRVLPAGDGEEVLRIAEQHDGPIHLLITDIVMPKLGGPELAEIFMQTRPQTRIIFCSGKELSDTGDDEWGTRGVKTLQKPVELNTLLGTVRQSLENGAVPPMLETDASVCPNCLPS